MESRATCRLCPCRLPARRRRHGVVHSKMVRSGGKSALPTRARRRRYGIVHSASVGHVPEREAGRRRVCGEHHPTHRHPGLRDRRTGRSSVRIAAIILCAVAGVASSGQGRKADYQRADGLRTLTQNKVFRTRVQPNWFDSDNRFWYRVDTGPGTQEFVLVDAEAGKRAPAFDHSRVAAALAKAVGKPAKADQLPLRGGRFAADGRSVLLYGTGDVGAWQLDLGTHALTKAPDGAFNEGNLESADAPYPSRRTGEETSISFVNRTQRELRVFWMDTDGARQPYSTLAPGARRDQHTFAGHVWLVTDASGAVMGVYEATETPGTAVIEGARTPRRQQRRGPPGRQPRSDVPSPDGKRAALIRDHNVWLREPVEAE
ncbi:MAG: hypothetical protein FJX72_21495, partial [Armatimonadetes bacterium]|nr:hypothetical protein [Armatimonadota bacterium]